MRQPGGETDKRRKAEVPLKILIVKRDKIGDLLLTTPMLSHLRASLPRAEIHLLANDYNAWVVADHPAIDRRWIYRRSRVGRRVRPLAAVQGAIQALQLRAQGFDWVIVANGSESHRAIRRGVMTGARRVVAYAADPAKYPRLTDPLAARTGRHESDLLLDMLAPLGVIAPSTMLYPQFRLSAAAQDFALGWLAGQGLRPGGYVVLGLGARRAKKQPDTAQVLRWSAHLRQAFGLDTVFMWTPGRSDNPLYPGDDDVAEPVLAAGAPQLHPFRGAIEPALGLIWNARASIFPDSGLMHFAAASPGGVVGLFADTSVSPHPDQWGPRGPRARWLEADISVSELSDAQLFDQLAPLLQQSPELPGD